VRALLIVAAVFSSGCFPVRYVVQAGAGQFELLHEARPIADVFADPAVPPRIRGLLAKVGPIKHFGQLNGLTPTSNYTHYADLHRAAAVWVVQACDPLSFKAWKWTFPVVGSVPYLGFFDEASARAYAKALAEEPQSRLPFGESIDVEPIDEGPVLLDVTVRTASAYSTLGWFRDPVLSTMIPDGDDAFPELANTILHESVHATIYVPDQSTFDESLASYVADLLTERLTLGAFGADSAVVRAWKAGEARAAFFSGELVRAHDDLQAIYTSSAPDGRKLELKRARLAVLQTTLGTKRAWNNADLAGIRTYSGGTAAFQRLRLACEGLPRMLAALKTLGPHDFKRPQQLEFDAVIDRLRERACPDQPSRSASRTPGN
jgi:predicted aminopeptidase